MSYFFPDDDDVYGDGGFRVCEDGTKKWYLGVTLHRENGPAIEYSNGDKEWIINGKPHRVGGPANEYYSSNEFDWYLHGKLHREDGPASERKYVKVWYRHGHLHRIDGPAIEWKCGIKEYYFEGYRINPKVLERIAARIQRCRTRTMAFIRDRLMPKIYDPQRLSGYRRMMESYQELEVK